MKSGLTRLPVRPPLAYARLDRKDCAFPICEMAVAVAEIELADVALDMRRADVMIDAGNAALEDREIALDGVCINVSAHIFSDAMLDCFAEGANGSRQRVPG